MNRLHKILLLILFGFTGISAQMIEASKPEAIEDRVTDLYTEIVLDSKNAIEFSSKYSADHGYTWTETDCFTIPIPYAPYGIQPGFMRSELVISASAPNVRRIFLNPMKLNPAPLSKILRSNNEEGVNIETNLNEGLFLSAEVKGKTYIGVTGFREQGLDIKTEPINSYSQFIHGIKSSKKNWQSLPPGPLRETLGNGYLQLYVDRGSPWVEIDNTGSPVDLEIKNIHFQLFDSREQKSISILKTLLTNRSGLTVKNITLSHYFNESELNSTDELIGCSPSLNLAFSAASNGSAGGERRLSGFAFLDSPQMTKEKLLSSFGVNRKYSGIKAEPRENILNIYKLNAENYNPGNLYNLCSDIDISKRYYLSHVPFDLLPGDTEEIILARFEFEGNVSEAIIDELREKLGSIKRFMNEDFGVDNSETEREPEYRIYQKFDLKVSAEGGQSQIFHIYLQVPEQTDKRRSSLKVSLIDLYGCKVYTITEGEYLPGIHKINLDAEVVNLPDGLYFCLLEAGENVRHRKSLFLR